MSLTVEKIVAMYRVLQHVNAARRRRYLPDFEIDIEEQIERFRDDLVNKIRVEQLGSYLRRLRRLRVECYTRAAAA
jgi:hypothetical protein